MTDSTLWFIAAAVFIGVELLTGTFYLLLYGLACAAAGLAALAGAPVLAQFPIAAAIAAGGTVWLRRHPIMRRDKSAQSLDVGQPVQVSAWLSPQHLRVRYRGSDWDAELTPPQTHQPSVLYIVGQRGNTLLVAEHAPKPTSQESS